MSDAAVPGAQAQVPGAKFREAFSVAPMLDVTTAAFRLLARLMSARAVLYTEMMHAEFVCRGKVRPAEYTGLPGDSVLQLGGADPARLCLAARTGMRLGFRSINLNAGCPSDRVQAGSFGAAMLLNLPHLADCVRAASDGAGAPVSVKTRIGVDDLDSREFTFRVVDTLVRAGCDHVILHARKCLLHGLSPRENRSVPPLDYGRVREVREAFPALRLTLNGGLQDLSECRSVLSWCDGVMLGRAVRDRPYLLTKVDPEIYGVSAAVTDRLAILHELRARCPEFVRSGGRVRDLVMAAMNLANGCAGARAYRQYLTQHAGSAADGDIFARAAEFVSGGGSRPDHDGQVEKNQEE